MKNIRASLERYYVLPCCLLLLNLCNEIISYKARFDPAIGPGNKPVKSAVAKSITWRVIF